MLHTYATFYFTREEPTLKRSRLRPGGGQFVPRHYLSTAISTTAVESTDSQSLLTPFLTYIQLSVPPEASSSVPTTATVPLSLSAYISVTPRRIGDHDPRDSSSYTGSSSRGAANDVDKPSLSHPCLDHNLASPRQRVWPCLYQYLHTHTYTH
jgi:hypothetical protein